MNRACFGADPSTVCSVVFRVGPFDRRRSSYKWNLILNSSFLFKLNFAHLVLQTCSSEKVYTFALQV